MSATDTRWAARETLMLGMQAAITNTKDDVVKQRAIDEFRRVEKFLGFEPNSWRSTV